MCGEVYLIGAGCGSYDLMTLRGLRCLEKCDTVVYDALIDERILGYVPENAEKIYVGKRSGAHSMKQDEINSLLVEKALDGRHIARLKGGDPFVFGRGGEEIISLIENKIPYTVIPGISSAIAVPELAGIPVTHRNVSRSFHVITAHTADEMKAEHFEKYAQLDGTLVFLMGLNNLDIIASSLIRAGFVADTPAAVISDGASRKQKIVRSDLGNICRVTAESKIKPPAVIVVGKTAGYDFSGNIRLPLSGISITVTGSRSFTDKFESAALSEGADVRKIVNIRIREYTDNEKLKNVLISLNDYRCIVITSRYGAEIFIDSLKRYNIDVRTLHGIQLAVIGSGTAETFRRNGIYPDIIPERYDSAGLAGAITQTIAKEDRILILNSEISSGDLTAYLDKKGFEYDTVKIYDTQEVPSDIKYVDDDYIVFGSSSGVRAFFENGGSFSDETIPVCIGEPTAETLRRYYKGYILTAEKHCVKGIIDAIKEKRKQ